MLLEEFANASLFRIELGLLLNLRGFGGLRSLSFFAIARLLFPKFVCRFVSVLRSSFDAQDVIKK